MPEPYWLLINRVLKQGRMSNSYKPALLRALADYGALGRSEINVRSIAQGSSEHNLSIVVLASDADEAIRQIHQEFELDKA